MVISRLAPSGAILELAGIRLGIQRLCSTSAESHGTSVLLLHHGQPRTPYYATQFLARSASLYYKLPESVTRFLSAPLTSKAKRCVEDYGEAPSIDERLAELDSALESSLSPLIPEFGPVSCSHAFLLEEPSIEQQLDAILEKKQNRLVVLPLYAHFSCFQTGAMLNRISKLILERTDPLVKESAEGQKQVERIVPLSDVSFFVSAIDRWSAHPVLPQFWSEQIKQFLGEIDAVMFMAPVLRGYDSNAYNCSVWSTCERTAELLGNSVAWKLAFYNSWDQWSLPPLRNNIHIQLRHLRRNKLERVLGVPITHVFPSFDTQTVLPGLFANQAGVSVLSPRSNDNILVHGLAEVVKNHLLEGRRTTAQLQMICKFCTDSECPRTRELFSR